MTVHRFDPLPTTEVEIEITRKAGKETGFGFIECKDYGVLVTDIVCYIFSSMRSISIILFILFFTCTNT